MSGSLVVLALPAGALLLTLGYALARVWAPVATSRLAWLARPIIKRFPLPPPAPTPVALAGYRAGAMVAAALRVPALAERMTIGKAALWVDGDALVVAAPASRGQFRPSHPSILARVEVSLDGSEVTLAARRMPGVGPGWSLCLAIPGVATTVTAFALSQWVAEVIAIAALTVWGVCAAVVRGLPRRDAGPTDRRTRELLQHIADAMLAAAGPGSDPEADPLEPEGP